MHEFEQDYPCVIFVRHEFCPLTSCLGRKLLRTSSSNRSYWFPSGGGSESLANTSVLHVSLTVDLVSIPKDSQILNLVNCIQLTLYVYISDNKRLNQ